MVKYFSRKESFSSQSAGMQGKNPKLIIVLPRSDTFTPATVENFAKGISINYINGFGINTMFFTAMGSAGRQSNQIKSN